jgi:hypothetical protein
VRAAGGRRSTRCAPAHYRNCLCQRCVVLVLLAIQPELARPILDAVRFPNAPAFEPTFERVSCSPSMARISGNVMLVGANWTRPRRVTAQ